MRSTSCSTAWKRSPQGSDATCGRNPHSRSERPYRIKLRFINPYAYRGAQLVAEFDAAVRTILTARHVGLINEEQSYRQIESCSAVLRSLFAIPQSYRVLRIDRATVKAGATAAFSAAEIMGPVPAAILLGEKRPRLAPRKAGL